MVNVNPQTSRTVFPLQGPPFLHPVLLTFSSHNHGVKGEISWVESIAEVCGNGDEGFDIALLVKLGSLQEADVPNHREWAVLGRICRSVGELL